MTQANNAQRADHMIAALEASGDQLVELVIASLIEANSQLRRPILSAEQTKILALRFAAVVLAKYEDTIAAEAVRLDLAGVDFLQRRAEKMLGAGDAA